MRKILISALVAALCGCATVARAPNVLGLTQDTQVSDKNYSLGVERTATIGEPVMRVRNYAETRVERQAMEASDSFILSGGGLEIPFLAHERVPIFGTRTNGGVSYTVAVKNGFGVQIAPDGSVAPGVINGVANGGGNIVMVYQFTPSVPTVRFTSVTDVRYRRRPTGSNYEITFNGIDSQAIHLQYREFGGDNLDPASPISTQDLSYPISTRTIRFRDIQVDVAAVDSQQIRYTVRSEQAPAPVSGAAAPTSP